MKYTELLLVNSILNFYYSQMHARPFGLHNMITAISSPKIVHAILTETLACFLPGRAKDLSAPLYCIQVYSYNRCKLLVFLRSAQLISYAYTPITDNPLCVRYVKRVCFSRHSIY